MGLVCAKIAAVPLAARVLGQGAGSEDTSASPGGAARCSPAPPATSRACEKAARPSVCARVCAGAAAAQTQRSAGRRQQSKKTSTLTHTPLSCSYIHNNVIIRMMSDWEVDLVEDNISEFNVTFTGPKDSERAQKAALSD